MLLELPHLAARAAPVGGRVHDDPVVVVAAADLPLDEFHAVVHEPAHRALRKAGGRGVLTRPLHHALRSVHVRHGRAGLHAGERRRARVAEQVQHTDLPRGVLFLRLADAPRRVVPVHALLGEDARMLEAHRL